MKHAISDRVAVIKDTDEEDNLLFWNDDVNCGFDR